MRRITYIVLAVLFVVLANTSLFAQGASRTYGAGRLQLDDGANNFVYLSTKTGTLGIDNTGAVIPGVQTFPSNCALLDLSSSTKGFLTPRMTNAQELAICGGTPNEGLIVYNTTTHTLDIYNGSGWAPLGGSGWSLFGNSLATGGGTALGQNFIGTLNATDFVVATNVGAAGSGVGERIRVTSGGNVGISASGAPFTPLTLFNVAGTNGVSNVRLNSLGGAPLLAPPINLANDGLVIGGINGDLLKYDVATVVGAVAWLRTGNTIGDGNNKLGTLNDIAVNITTNNTTRVLIGNSVALNAVTITGNELINGNDAVTGTFTSAGNSTVGTNAATTNTFGNGGAAINAIGNNAATNGFGNLTVGGGFLTNTIGNLTGGGGIITNNIALNTGGGGIGNNNFGSNTGGGGVTTNTFGAANGGIVTNNFGQVSGGAPSVTNNIGTTAVTNNILGTTNINTSGAASTTIGNTGTGGAVSISSSNPNPITVNVGATTNNLVLNNILQDNTASNILMLTGVNSGNTRTRSLASLIAANEGLVLDLTNPALPTVKLGSAAGDPVNAFATNRTVSIGNNILNFNNGGLVTFARLNGLNNTIDLNNFSAVATTNVGFDAVGNAANIQARTTNVGTLSSAQVINIGIGGGNTTIGLAPGSTNNINGTNNTMTATNTNLLTGVINTINGSSQNNVTAPTNIVTGNTLNSLVSTTENRVTGPTNINTTANNLTTIGQNAASASTTVINVGTAAGNLTLNNILNDNTTTSLLMQTGTVGSGNVRFRSLNSLINANQGLFLDLTTTPGTPIVKLGSNVGGGEAPNPFLSDRTVSLGGQSINYGNAAPGATFVNFNGGTNAVNINTTTAGITTIGNTGATTNVNGPTNINNNINSNTQINTGTSSGAVTIGNGAASTVQITSGTAINANSPNNTLTATSANLLTGPSNTLTGGASNNINAPTNNMNGSTLNNITSATENRVTGVTNINTTANNLTTIGQNAGTGSSTTINVGTVGGNLALNNIVNDNTTVSLLTTTGIGAPASGNVRYRTLNSLINANQGLFLDLTTTPGTPIVKLGSALGAGEAINPFTASRTVSLGGQSLLIADGNSGAVFAQFNGVGDAISFNTTTAGTTTIGNTGASTVINGPTAINNNINSNTQINTGTSSGTVTIGNGAASTVQITSGTAINANSPNNTLTATTANLLTAPSNTLTGGASNNVNAPTNNINGSTLNNVTSATENRVLAKEAGGI